MKVFEQWVKLNLLLLFVTFIEQTIRKLFVEEGAELKWNKTKAGFKPVFPVRAPSLNMNREHFNRNAEIFGL